MRYKIQKAGDWIQPRMKNYYVSCCDCGLAHRINFRLVPYGSPDPFSGGYKSKRKIQFQVFRVKK